MSSQCICCRVWACIEEKCVHACIEKHQLNKASFCFKLCVLCAAFCGEKLGVSSEVSNQDISCFDFFFPLSSSITTAGIHWNITLYTFLLTEIPLCPADSFSFIALVLFKHSYRCHWQWIRFTCDLVSFVLPSCDLHGWLAIRYQVTTKRVLYAMLILHHYFEPILSGVVFRKKPLFLPT